MQKLKQGLDQGIDFVAKHGQYYIHNHRILVGITFIAAAALSVLIMSHAFGVTEEALAQAKSISLWVTLGGLGLLGIRFLLSHKYGKNKPTYIYTSLKTAVSILTILGVSAALGGVLSLFSSGAVPFTKSFFDGANLIGLPIFGLTLLTGGIGVACLLGLFKNKTVRQVFSLVGSLGYLAAVGWLMANFYHKGDPFSGTVSSALMIPGFDMLENALIQFFRCKDRKKDSEINPSLYINNDML